MTQFEYLGVFISVIVGLAVAHMITSAGKVILNRKEIQLYWPHSLWCLNILLYLVNFWWFIFSWSHLQKWHYLIFLLLIFYAILLSLLTLVLIPQGVRSGFNFMEHFYARRKWFFGLSTIIWLFDLAETYMKDNTGAREMHNWYLPFVLVIIGLTSIGIFTGNKKFHAFFSVFWFIWVMGYVLLALKW